MSDHTTSPFSFPAVCTKKISAAFDGGRLGSDGGVMLLAQAERKLMIADKPAAAIADRRDPARTIHTLSEHFARAHSRHCVWL